MTTGTFLIRPASPEPVAKPHQAPAPVTRPASTAPPVSTLLTAPAEQLRTAAEPALRGLTTGMRDSLPRAGDGVRALYNRRQNPAAYQQTDQEVIRIVLALSRRFGVEGQVRLPTPPRALIDVNLPFYGRLIDEGLPRIPHIPWVSSALGIPERPRTPGLRDGTPSRETVLQLAGTFAGSNLTLAGSLGLSFTLLRQLPGLRMLGLVQDSYVALPALSALLSVAGIVHQADQLAQQRQAQRQGFISTHVTGPIEDNIGVMRLFRWYEEGQRRGEAAYTDPAHIVGEALAWYFGLRGLSWLVRPGPGAADWRQASADWRRTTGPWSQQASDWAAGHRQTAARWWHGPPPSSTALVPWTPRPTALVPWRPPVSVTTFSASRGRPMGSRQAAMARLALDVALPLGLAGAAMYGRNPTRPSAGVGEQPHRILRLDPDPFG